MFYIETRAVYSVLATERSFVLGVSRLEKQLFVRMLIDKVTNNKLPVELGDIIKNDLLDYYWTPTAKSWERADDHWRERHPGLYWDRFMTESSIKAWRSLADSLGLTLAAREGPYDKLLAEQYHSGTKLQPLDPFVVHITRAGRFNYGDIGLCSGSLSALKIKEKHSNDLRPGVPVPSYDSNVTRFQSGICTTSLDEEKGTLEASFVATSGGEHRMSDKVERFMELEGIEEAMKSWDQEAVEECMKVLGLEMVGTKRGGDELKPRLRIVQSFASGRGLFDRWYSKHHGMGVV